MAIVTLPPNYKPLKKEPYMNDMQIEYFRQKLLVWKSEVIKESEDTLNSLKEEGGINEPDITDRATVETDMALELKSRDRLRKLIKKIDKALAKIDDGSYGYCEETGEPIGLDRLEVKPNAEYSLEAQERHEKLEKTLGKAAVQKGELPELQHGKHADGEE